MRSLRRRGGVPRTALSPSNVEGERRGEERGNQERVVFFSVVEKKAFPGQR